MSPLSESERQKIVEEERLRAAERAKYNQPQQIVVKQKRSSGAAIGCLVLIIIGVGSALVLNALGDAREKASKKIEQAASSLPPITEPAFDIPALIGNNLQEVRQILGTPTVDDSEPNEKQQDFTTWNKTWEKDGTHLMVTYNPQTLLITDFFVSLGGTKSTSDTDHLLKIGNLKKNDPRYTVEFTACRNCAEPTQYLGVTVTPK